MPLPPGELPAGFDIAIEAWRMLGSQMDWAGVEMVADMLGVDDIEMLVYRLIAIRDVKNGGK